MRRGKDRKTRNVVARSDDRLPLVTLFIQKRKKHINDALSVTCEPQHCLMLPVKPQDVLKLWLTSVAAHWISIAETSTRPEHRPAARPPRLVRLGELSQSRPIGHADGTSQYTMESGASAILMGDPVRWLGI
ncbi:hypothetical protein IF1G_08192 [Cordyceps javanica]|uniref:Uncharacterized protein n=1 Tax=Cordyceps javanica TaxID=43265 RepID=A0A545UTW1_9HYPO|nr:hypothetical protein IF1G_08192 [Cordyceps javanica]